MKSHHNITTCLSRRTNTILNMCTDPLLRRPCFRRRPCFESSCVLIRVSYTIWTSSTIHAYDVWINWDNIVTSQECVKCYHVHRELTRVSTLSLQTIHPVEPVGPWYPRNPRVPTVLCDNQSNLKQEQKDCSTAAEPPEGLNNGHTHRSNLLCLVRTRALAQYSKSFLGFFWERLF